MNNKIQFLIIILSLLLCSQLFASDKAGEYIDWQVLSGGSIIKGGSANYFVDGTLSQTAVGEGSSANYTVIHGFWQDFGIVSGDCCDYPGDANNNGAINVLDLTYLINYIYLTGPEPPCMFEGDISGNCAINVLDITYIIAYLYLEGPLPVCASSCSW